MNVLNVPNVKHIVNGVYHVPLNTSEIGESDFVKSEYFTHDILGLILPEGIRKISNNAFFDCFTKIKKICLPSTLEEIGSEAFWGLDSLEKVFINSRIKIICKNAFCNCRNLTIHFAYESYYVPEQWHKDWNCNCKISFSMKNPCIKRRAGLE